MPPLSKLAFVAGLMLMAYAFGAVIGLEPIFVGTIGFALASFGVYQRFREYHAEARSAKATK